MAKKPVGPALNDPMEGAKLSHLGKPSPEEMKAEEPKAEVEAPKAAAAEEKAEAKVEAPIEAPPIEAPPAPKAPLPVEPVAAKRYRVKTRTTISLNGQIVVLHPDDVVSAEGYGPLGMQRILDSNVDLEELKG